MDIQTVRDLFPDRNIPSDEEIQQAQQARESALIAEREQAEEIERKKQSLRDQITNLQTELNNLEAPAQG